MGDDKTVNTLSLSAVISPLSSPSASPLLSPHCFSSLLSSSLLSTPLFSPLLYGCCWPLSSQGGRDTGRNSAEEEPLPGPQCHRDRETILDSDWPGPHRDRHRVSLAHCHPQTHSIPSSCYNYTHTLTLTWTHTHLNSAFYSYTHTFHKQAQSLPSLISTSGSVLAT